MAGFPFAAIGAGLGQGVQALQQQRQQEIQNAVRLFALRQAQQQQQQQQDVGAGTFNALLAGAGDSGLPPSQFQNAPAAAGPSLSPGGMAPPATSLPGSRFMPGGSGFQSGLNALTSLGLDPNLAGGATDYMTRNESRGPQDVNPASGAFGRAQWLGPRKTRLQQEFGAAPTDEQQGEFIKEELGGPESRTLADLRAAQARGGSPEQLRKAGYDIWGRDYERPGEAALAKAGVGAPPMTGQPADLGGLPPEVHQEVQATSTDVAKSIDPSLYGRMSLQAMAKRVDAANPNASPLVKTMIVERLAKLIAPEQRVQFQMALQNNRQEIQLALKQMQIDAANQRATQSRVATAARATQAQEGRGWQVLTDPTNNKQYRFQPSTGQAFDFAGQPYTPGGAEKIAGPGQVQLPALPELSPTAEWAGKPNKPPPADLTGGTAINPGVWAAAVTYAKSGGTIKPPFSLWGTNPMAQQFNQALPAAQAALKMTPDQMTNLAAAYQGERAAATTIGHVTGSTAQGAQELQQFGPFVRDALSRINQTEFPTINSVANAVRRGTGNEDIIQLNSYIQSAKNAYVLVMTRSGRPTVWAGHRADELLSPNMAVGQIEAALQAMSNEAAVAQSSAKRATQEVTGQPQSPMAAPPQQAAPGGTGRTVVIQNGMRFDKDTGEYLGPAQQ